MKLRIDRIYGIFFHSGFCKYEVVARCYINGKCRIKRLFFNTAEETGTLAEGCWVEY